MDIESSNGYAVEARGLVKRYRGSRGQTDVEAVRGVDLHVRRGEIFGFLGPNGAGKTTTVRMLCTLLPISAGEAVVAGVDVRHDPGRGAPANRRGVARGRARLHADRPGASRIAVRALPHPRSGRPQRRTDRTRRPERGGRPAGEGVLGRHEAPPRPRHRPRARTRGAVPRRADHRPRPSQPRHRVGRGTADQRGRDDGLPHHPIPGGSRSALRAHRDHRRGHDRRAGHPGRAEVPAG